MKIRVIFWLFVSFLMSTLAFSTIPIELIIDIPSRFFIDFNLDEVIDDILLPASDEEEVCFFGAQKKAETYRYEILGADAKAELILNWKGIEFP